MSVTNSVESALTLQEISKEVAEHGLTPEIEKRLRATKRADWMAQFGLEPDNAASDD